MRSRRGSMALPLACVAVLAAADLPYQISSLTPVAFVNVNVAPMDAERILERHTVVVRNGRIVALGPAESTGIPVEAEVIDAAGMYLMPGLADMHTHFTHGDPAWRNNLFLFVANGVTTVREMWGEAAFLNWRDAVAGGSVIGPRIFQCSPGMDGAGGVFTAGTPPIVTADQARSTVASYKSAGYDFIKVYSALDRDVYSAILAEAAAQNIKAVGHKPSRVSLWDVLAARQASIEHLGGIGERALVSGSMTTGTLDAAALAEVAVRVRESGVWNVPTLQVMLISADMVPALQQRPQMRYISPAMKAWFQTAANQAPVMSTARRESNYKQVVRALFDAGAPMMLGVDSGFRYVLPGFSVHDELRLTVEAGLSPYETLRLATVNAAIFTEQWDSGTIAVGNRADLLLVYGDPLADVANAARRAGVMLAGQWLSERRLADGLEEIAASYGN